MFPANTGEPTTVSRSIILPAVSIEQWIAGLIPIAIIVSFLVGFIYLLFGLVRLRISVKNKELKPQAKKNIFLASIILTVVFIVWGIFQVIKQIPEHPDYREGELEEIFTTLFPSQPPVTKVISPDSAIE